MRCPLGAIVGMVGIGVLGVPMTVGSGVAHRSGSLTSTLGKATIYRPNLTGTRLGRIGSVRRTMATAVGIHGGAGPIMIHGAMVKRAAAVDVGRGGVPVVEVTIPDRLPTRHTCHVDCWHLAMQTTQIFSSARSHQRTMSCFCDLMKV